MEVTSETKVKHYAQTRHYHTVFHRTLELIRCKWTTRFAPTWARRERGKRRQRNESIVSFVWRTKRHWINWLGAAIPSSATIIISSGGTTFLTNYVNMMDAIEKKKKQTRILFGNHRLQWLRMSTDRRSDVSQQPFRPDWVATMA